MGEMEDKSYLTKETLSSPFSTLKLSSPSFLASGLEYFVVAMALGSISISEITLPVCFGVVIDKVGEIADTLGTSVGPRDGNFVGPLVGLVVGSFVGS